MIPFLTGIPWRLLGIGVAVIAIAALGLKVNGWRNDSHELARIQPAYDALVEAQSKANEKVEKQKDPDEADRVKLSKERELIESERAAIAREWERIRATEESTDEAGNPVIRLSTAWGVCFAAAAAGDAADVAACQAAGGDGAIEADAGHGGL